ncbi:MAG: pyridoxal phosphate-dependent aminotransferase [Prevotella sp.]|nr:pyridoxal phosphate-dependent aminotransferase [Prevotella sp.]
MNQTTKYNFDEIVTRRGSHCYKWDLPKEDDVLPMWIADMDFKAAPAIRQALQCRLDHGVFGYTLVPQSYYDAVISWFDRRHDWKIEQQWIIYTIGVVPAVTCAIKAIAQPGENVLVQTPVYNCFFTCIKNSGCQILENPLLRKDDSYIIDFDDFEQKCADAKTTVFLLCNPHNPAGRVWTKDELARMNEICMRHGVTVIADEIHCELVMPGYKYTPFASVNSACEDNCVILNSPSKSFNIAGLQTSNIICKSPSLRHRIDRIINIHETCDLNPFGPVALEAAYNESEDWIDELNEYIWDNYQALKAFLNEHIQQMEVLKMEGSYLPWINIEKLGISSDTAAARLLHEGRVMVNSGTMYGRNAGEGYLRVNIACPRSVMMEGLERIKRVFG